MKSILNKVKKHKILSIVIVLIVLGGCVVMFGNTPNLELKEERVVIEFGEKLPNDLKQFVKVDEKYEKDVTFSSDDIDDFHKVLPVGQYTITFECLGVERDLSVEVQDTQAPEIILKDSIQILENEKVNYNEYVDVKDKSLYQITFDDSNVQYDQKGDYEVIATVIDESDNKTVMNIPIKINELKLEVVSKSLSLNSGNSTTIKVSTNSQEQILYSSSNESVAVVDQNGKVTAKGTGTATITAKVQGKETKCNVSVKEKKKESTISHKTTNQNKSTNQKKSTNKTNHSTKQNGATVYITNTGSKYHRSGCQYLRKSKIAISKSNAQSQGYTPCSRCHP